MSEDVLGLAVASTMDALRAVIDGDYGRAREKLAQADKTLVKYARLRAVAVGRIPAGKGE